MENINPALLGVIPVIVALVSMIKGLGMSAKYAPVVSILLGVGSAFLFVGGTVGVIIVSGIVAGLSASGMYSGVKTTVS